VCVFIYVWVGVCVGVCVCVCVPRRAFGRGRGVLERVFARVHKGALLDAEGTRSIIGFGSSAPSRALGGGR
jgi:hypothetical protein